MACVNIAGALLAAGAGTRLGGNKLEAVFGDDMLGMHAARTLAAANCRHLFAVHDPANQLLARALRNAGFVLIDNKDARAGMAHSLALAAAAALEAEADALLICLADMPFVTTAHLARLIAAGSDHAIVSTNGATRMPPAIVPRAMLGRLTARAGDHGARDLLRDAATIAAPAALLADIDTPADMLDRQ